MRDILFVCSFFLLSLTPSQDTTTYICVSPTAERYHPLKTCYGLQRCTHVIKKTTVEEAKKLGYTRCQIKSCK